MAQPYSTAAQVKNQAVGQMVTDAGWVDPDDIDDRIAEADAEVDARLGAIGYALPFASNPQQVTRLSILYARYACCRDLFAANAEAKAAKDLAQVYLDEFEGKLLKLEQGMAALVDAGGAVVSRTRSVVLTAQKANPSEFTAGWIDHDDIDLPSELSDDPAATE